MGNIYGTNPTNQDQQITVDKKGCLFVSTLSGAGTGIVNTPSIQNSPNALPANPNRVGWQIQNVGTNPLFILLGTGASTSVFHLVVKGGSADSDGYGGSFFQTEGAVYTGAVTVAGTSPKYVVTELTV